MKKKVLLIDDDTDILETVSFFLEKEGFGVIGLTDGKKTYQCALELRPDIIILDYWLWGGNSGSLAKKLKTSRSTRRIPVIFLSANSRISAIAAQTGVDGFIAKPCNIDELIALVGRLTNHTLSPTKIH